MQHCDVSVDNSNCLPKSARGPLAQPVLISVIHSDSPGSSKKHERAAVAATRGWFYKYQLTFEES